MYWIIQSLDYNINKNIKCHKTYIIEGNVRHEFGAGLRKTLDNQSGDFIYIKPGVPHEVFNLSDTDPVVAFVARAAADEWEKIIPYDRNSE